MFISNLTIYPIKSCAGVDLKSCELTRFGLRDDRRWMLIDRAGRFQSQRQFAKLATVQPTPVRNDRNQTIAVTATAPGMPKLYCPINKNGDIVHATVWEQKVKGCRDQGIRAARWFEVLLGVREGTLRFVYCDDSVRRQVPQKYAISRNDVTGFADGFP
eukprot:g2999.t1